MAIHQDVEVKVALRPASERSSDPHVLPSGEALKEYLDPSPKLDFDGFLVEKYIEGVSDQEFQIEIYFQSTFSMFDADNIKVNLNIDYGTVSSAKIFSRPEIEYNMARGTPLIIRNVYDTNNKTEHRRLSFSFASLQGDENLEIEDDLADAKAEKMGVIMVGVSRMSSKKLLGLQELGIIPKSIPKVTSAQANQDEEPVAGIVKREEGSNGSNTITALRIQMENKRLRSELAAAKAANEGTPKIKQEKADATTGESARSKRAAKRAAKRQKVVIELE
ncbi:MAG: hypothetical protein Q9195_007530 [Heterodermia aff. obscurata]